MGCPTARKFSAFAWRIFWRRKHEKQLQSSPSQKKSDGVHCLDRLELKSLCPSGGHQEGQKKSSAPQKALTSSIKLKRTWVKAKTKMKRKKRQQKRDKMLSVLPLRGSHLSSLAVTAKSLTWGPAPPPTPKKILIALHGQFTSRRKRRDLRPANADYHWTNKKRKKSKTGTMKRSFCL